LKRYSPLPGRGKLHEFPREAVRCSACSFEPDLYVSQEGCSANASKSDERTAVLKTFTARVDERKTKRCTNEQRISELSKRKESREDLRAERTDLTERTLALWVEYTLWNKKNHDETKEKINSSVVYKRCREEKATRN